MWQLLETGQALYVLAGICLLGILTRLMTRNLYKRLIKESANMAAVRNKGLKELKIRAENTYRMNQGIRDCGSWLEHQLCELRFRGMTLSGWANLATELTWLCLLAGGGAAFAAYWYRLDTFYIVLYGGGAVLMAMGMMLFDNGNNSGRREYLTVSLLDYLENVLCPRLARNLPEEDGRGASIESLRGKVRSIGRVSGRGGEERTGLAGRERTTGREGLERSERAAGRDSLERGDRSVGRDMPERGERTLGRDTLDRGERAAGRENLEREERTGLAGRERTAGRESLERSERAAGRDTPEREERPGGAAGSGSGSGRKSSRNSRRETAATTEPVEAESPEEGGARKEPGSSVEDLRRSLEQIAASREKDRKGEENWLKELKPEDVQLIGDILKEYLA